jgi:putative thioredoxin
MKREAAKSPEIEALEAQLAQDPDNLDVRHQLALQYTSMPASSGTPWNNSSHILQRDLNHGDGATKKVLLDTIASLGKGDPLAAEYQRKLYSLLY